MKLIQFLAVASTFGSNTFMPFKIHDESFDSLSPHVGGVFVRMRLYTFVS